MDTAADSCPGQKGSHVVSLIAKTHIAVAVAGIHVVIFRAALRIDISHPCAVDVCLVSAESGDVKAGGSHFTLKLLFRPEDGRGTALV